MKNKAQGALPPKLNPEWVRESHREFADFLRSTRFPEPQRHGQRGSCFRYPESLILFLAVLAVKCKVKTYQDIHRLVVQVWPVITPAPELAPISESQLRDRLKKIRHHPRRPAAFISALLPQAPEAEGGERG